MSRGLFFLSFQYDFIRINTVCGNSQSFYLVAEPNLQATTIVVQVTMQLLTNESAIISSNNDKVVLTTHRISLEEKEWGRSYSIYLFLEDISSIQVHFTTTPLWLILSVISALVALVAIIQGNSSDYYDSDQRNTIMGLGLIGAVVFFFLWRSSRQHILSIYPDGGQPLKFLVSGMNNLQIDDFVYKVQQAKSDRMNSLVTGRLLSKSEQVVLPSTE